MKILMVLTSHDQLGDTGEKTGFWLEEFAAPYYVFQDAGAEIALASPLGGQSPLDLKSDAGITVLANLITLTPGTLSLDVSPDRKTLFVHALHVEDPDAFRREVKEGFERRVKEAGGRIR